MRRSIRVNPANKVAARLALTIVREDCHVRLTLVGHAPEYWWTGGGTDFAGTEVRYWHARCACGGWKSVSATTKQNDVRRGHQHHLVNVLSRITKEQ